ncbi:MAG: 5'/3'-nucleotidase SurE [Rhodospirillales bacterium]
MMGGGKPLDLSRARILISNDDGIEAPGLRLLERILKPLAAEVWVVAPLTEQSAAGHSLTLRRPLRINRLGPRRFTVDGTPTDCVLLGVNQVMKDNRPDLVISGINQGGNLGEDVTYSGTVAAAMEGTLMGIRAISLSQVTDDKRATRWAASRKWTQGVLKKLAAQRWPQNVLINVNFPDVPAARVTGIEVTRQGNRKIGGQLAEGVDPRGDTYFWIGNQRIEDRFKAGTDLEAVIRGAVSITPLTLDLTHASTLKSLKAVFG